MSEKKQSNLKVDKNQKPKKIKKSEQFEIDAKKLLELVDKENIVSATHCQTRVRLVLTDHKKVDTDAIEELPSVKGSFYAQGQYQIVIGTEVAEFFKFFTKEGNIKLVSKDEQKEIVKIQGNFFQKAMAVFSEIFIALIPVIVAGGLILAFRNILELDWNPDVNVDWTIVGHSSFLNGLDKLLWLPANAIFWYLPVYVVWSMFNRKGKAQVLGIVIGIMLVSPGILVNYYDVSGAIGSVHLNNDITGLLTTSGGTVTILASGNYALSVIIDAINSAGGALGVDASFNDVNAILTAHGNGAYQITNVFLAIKATGAYYFNGWPLAISYIGQVIPALLVGAFSVWFFEFIERHTFSAVKYVWPPFITMLVTIFVAHGVLGPIGAGLSYLIDTVFAWGFTNPIAKWFIGPIFGLLYPVIVITGVHHTLNAVMLDLTAYTSMAATGSNYIFPILALSNMAQGSAVLAVFWMLRFDEESREETSAAGITCWLGVTEPAMFGYNLKYMFPFIAGMCASGIGGLLVVAFNITAFGIGMGGLLGFLNINSIFGGTNIIVAWTVYILIMILIVVVSFILTIIFSKFEKIFAPISAKNFSSEIKKLKLKQVNNE